MQIISIPFGSAGSSWFFWRGTKPSGKIWGHRWEPEYRGPGGAWAAIPITISGVPATFNRIPKCNKPQAPTAAMLADWDRKVIAKREQDKADMKLVASYPIGTEVSWQQKGDHVDGNWDSTAVRTTVGKVVKNTGLYLVVAYSYTANYKDGAHTYNTTSAFSGAELRADKVKRA